MPSVALSASASGDNTVLAAPAANQFIRVLGYVLVAANTVSVTWKSASTALSGAMPLIASSGAAAGVTGRDGWFDCNPGEALVLNLSGAVGVYGHVRYATIGA